jgi:hypothetical protein
MIAISFRSEDAARAVSRGLFLLSRPARFVDEGTLYLATVFAQPDGTAVLLIDPGMLLPIHPDVAAQITDPADKDGSRAQMAALLGPLLADPASGLATAAGLIAKGGTLAMDELLPLIQLALVADYLPPVRTAP